MPRWPNKTRRAARRALQPRSLFGEILNWMLLPFIIVWPISLFLIYKMAIPLANQPYDAALAESVRAISRQVQLTKQGVAVDFPVSPQTLLRDDGEDAIYYQVLGPRREFISGERALPLGALPESPVRSGQVYFRDDQLAGREVRVGYQFVRLESEPPEWVQVQVAETRNKRNAMTYRIIAGVLIPQLAMLPLAAWLAYLGLRRGILPLVRLQKRIRTRCTSDLTPLAIERAPLELRPLISAFNGAMQQLKDHLRAHQRFIADAAHQLRTPLTGLRMQTELALRERDPEQLRALLPALAKSTERVCHLANQLLMLARAEGAPVVLTAGQTVTLAPLLAEVISDLVPRATEKNIDIDFTGPAAPLLVQGDAMLLAEMFKNLLDNAIKYAHHDGRISIRLQGGDEASVEIQDYGIGISPAELPHVFDRFYRVLGTRTDGSGLGLPIAREIALRHRGHVELAPNPDGPGCVARVRLPRAPAMAPHAEASAPFEKFPSPANSKAA